MDLEVLEMPTPNPVQVSSGDSAYGIGGREVNADDWGKYYRDYRTVAYRHQFLEDAYTGQGGFLGDVPLTDNYKGNQNNNPYTWLTPDSTELQFLSRAKNTELYNMFSRFINSRIGPIFAGDEIKTITTQNGVVRGNDKFNDFVSDCTGTGMTFAEFQETELTDADVHGVSYVAMDMTSGRELPVVYNYSALSLDTSSIVTDTDKKLVAIAFLSGEHRVKGVSYPKRIKYYMEDGYCHVVEQYEDAENQWFDIETPKNTGVDEMIVFPHFTDKRKAGQYYKETPESYNVARCTTDIWNKLSWTMWNLKLHGFPIFYAYNVKGISRSLGHIISLTTSADGTAVPPPNFASPDTAGLQRCFEALEYLEKQARQIMREYGVIMEESATSQAQSGESKTFDFWATNETLKKSVKKLRVLDAWVYKMFNKYTGRGDEWEYKRYYPEDFTPRTEHAIVDLHDTYRILANEGAQESAKDVLKLIVSKIVGPNSTVERMSELVEEISGISTRPQKDVE